MDFLGQNYWKTIESVYTLNNAREGIDFMVAAVNTILDIKTSSYSAIIYSKEKDTT